MWRLELSLVPEGEGVQKGFIVGTAILIDVGAVPIPDMGGFLEAALVAVSESVVLAFTGGFKR